MFSYSKASSSRTYHVKKYLYAYFFAVLSKKSSHIHSGESLMDTCNEYFCVKNLELRTIFYPKANTQVSQVESSKLKANY